MKKVGLMAACLLFLAGCQSTEQTTNTSTKESSPSADSQQVLQLSALEEFALTSDVGQPKITQEDQTWSVNEEESPLMKLFVEEIDSVKGSLIDKITGETQFQLVLPEGTASFAKDGDTWQLAYQDQEYQLSNVGPLLQDFEGELFSGEAIGDPAGYQEIKIKEGDRNYRYTTKTTLSEVEQKPLVSGWFVQDHYQKAMSLNYDYANYLLSAIKDLRGTKVSDSDASEKLAVLRTLTFADDFTWQISKYEDTYYLTDEKDQLWQIPTTAGKLFTKPVFDSVDRFLMLIMADALDEVDITVGKTQHQVKATHESNSNTFTLDDQDFLEADFRSLYQYIAVLAPEAEYQDQEIKSAASATITYLFTSNEKQEKRELAFYPLADDESQLAVSIDGKMDFITSQDQLDEMLSQLDNALK